MGTETDRIDTANEPVETDDNGELMDTGVLHEPRKQRTGNEKPDSTPARREQ